jgi:hypothetical protein
MDKHKEPPLYFPYFDVKGFAKFFYVSGFTKQGIKNVCLNNEYKNEWGQTTLCMQEQWHMTFTWICEYYIQCKAKAKWKWKRRIWWIRKLVTRGPSCTLLLTTPPHILSRGLGNNPNAAGNSCEWMAYCKVRNRRNHSAKWTEWEHALILYK